MTRKDFEFIATALARSRPDMPTGEDTQAYEQWLATVDEFANNLVLTNINFDADRFKNAAGA